MQPLWRASPRGCRSFSLQHTRIAVPVRRLFTSESVTAGHPDKIADQISDACLDAILADDPTARVACETLVTTGLACVAGEITTKTYVDIPRIVRGTIERIGYTDASFGFDSNTCAVINSIGTQSPDIAMGVDTGGAGDQGMMFGYATDETPELMPLPIILAHRITKKLSEVRRSKGFEWLRPDGKSQVTVLYEDNMPVHVDTVVLSTQHADSISTAKLRREIAAEVIEPMIPDEFRPRKKMTVHINPTGRFVVGGPQGDAGLTGRKIIVDTYGGMGRHGGGAFSGKDPSKVDRSACYAARWVAKNIVAAGLADRFEIQLSYAIGVAHPLSISVETFGTGRIPDEQIEALIQQHFDLRPGAIIRDLRLRRPIYKATAAYGHFGRTDIDAPWEQTDKVEELSAKAGRAVAVH